MGKPKRDLVRAATPETEDLPAVVILCDISGSMRGQPMTRLREHLSQMWSEVSDFTKLFAFADSIREVTSPEKLPEAGGGTFLKEAFEHVVSFWPPRTILISDGLPQDMEGSLEAAQKLPGTIDAIFVGPETDRRGIEFMRRLTTANGGQTIVRDLHTTKALLGPALRELLALPAPISL